MWGVIRLCKPRLQEVGASATLNPSPGRDYQGRRGACALTVIFPNPRSSLATSPLPSFRARRRDNKKGHGERGKQEETEKKGGGWREKRSEWRAKYEETGGRKGLVPEEEQEGFVEITEASSVYMRKGRLLGRGKQQVEEPGILTSSQELWKRRDGDQKGIRESGEEGFLKEKDGLLTWAWELRSPPIYRP